MRGPLPLLLVAVAATASVGAAWLGCGPGPGPGQQEIHANFGDTCGDVQYAPFVVAANCSFDGAVVQYHTGGQDCVQVDPSNYDAMTGLAPGLCTMYCGYDGGPACPAGYGCGLADGLHASNVCMKPCATTDDCPAPLQICKLGYCQPDTCKSDEACPEGRCVGGLCVHRDASTL
jgi:hypothetical protein